MLGQDADCYTLEPTGTYLCLWIDQLQKNGKEVRLVSPLRVRAYCQYKSIVNKADKPDAAAIAADSTENYFDAMAFLSLEQLTLRESYLALKNTINSLSPIANRLGHRLSYECPEIVKTAEKCRRKWGAPLPPAILRYIADEERAD